MLYGIRCLSVSPFNLLLCSLKLSLICLTHLKYIFLFTGQADSTHTSHESKHIEVHVVYAKSCIRSPDWVVITSTRSKQFEAALDMHEVETEIHLLNAQFKRVKSQETSQGQVVPSSTPSQSSPKSTCWKKFLERTQSNANLHPGPSVDLSNKTAKSPSPRKLTVLETSDKQRKCRETSEALIAICKWWGAGETPDRAAQTSHFIWLTSSRCGPYSYFPSRDSAMTERQCDKTTVWLTLCMYSTIGP